VDNAAPITHITNGVHVPTWQDARVRGAQHDPAKLWEAHVTLKRELLADASAPLIAESIGGPTMWSSTGTGRSTPSARAPVTCS
jgi:hypothetical protein